VGLVGAEALPARPWPAVRLADLVELTKPRIATMVMVMAAAGFFLASAGDLTLRLLPALLGTGLLAAGAGALNHVWERDVDARMRRTANRPLPSGRMDPDVALAFGVVLVLAGLASLALLVNPLTALLGAATVAGYVFVYTPMKRFTSLATVVGAVPGAMPPLMGWAAVRDGLGPGAWALFGLLFLWQLPHFLSIAWIYRADYARGGFPMLTVLDPEGRRTARQVLLWCAALVPVSLLPTVLGLSGSAYFLGALLLGAGYLAACFAFARSRSEAAARRLLLTSVVYLPAILTALVLDRLVGG
jgi:protoheme IX farnesyltransferase